MTIAMQPLTGVSAGRITSSMLQPSGNMCAYGTRVACVHIYETMETLDNICTHTIPLPTLTLRKLQPLTLPKKLVHLKILSFQGCLGIYLRATSMRHEKEQTLFQWRLIRVTPAAQIHQPIYHLHKSRHHTTHALSSA